jgi:hypothetical protein
VVGIHLSYIPGSYAPYLGPGARELSAAEQAFQQERERWTQTEGGYSQSQRTKPQTLADGLNDSPAGLAAWIVEKFRAWSDCDGEVERRFSKDELLTNIAIYWFTETIGSSTRLYYEGRQRPLQFEQGERMQVPCGVARLPKEAPMPPREWVERCYNLQHWPSCRAAATSRRWRSRSCWRRISAPSSGRCDRVQNPGMRQRHTKERLAERAFRAAPAVPVSARSVRNIPNRDLACDTTE